MTTSLTNHPVMIIDGHNLFIRGFVVSPQMNTMGEPNGGVVTFFKTLRSLIDKHVPSHVFIAWDAGNGSQRRRKIYSDYKKGRRPLKLNRQLPGQEKNVELDQKKQLFRTVEYMKHLPVKQFFVEDCEADDVIAAIRFRLPAEKPCIIVSSDKDYYQLIDEKTKVFNPITKVFASEEECLERFSASPQNLTIARAFLGDKSDNIPGVKSIGPKWLKKNLPILSEDRDVPLFEVRDKFKENSDSKLKTWRTGFENFDIVKRNFKLMHLDPNFLSSTQQNKIEKILFKESDDAYCLNKMDLMKLMRKDNIIGNGHFELESWSTEFMRLLHLSRREKLFSNE